MAESHRKLQPLSFPGDAICVNHVMIMLVKFSEDEIVPVFWTLAHTGWGLLERRLSARGKIL